MENMVIDRHSPLLLKNGQLLKNRVIVPPMASQTADSEGFVTQSTLDHYQNLCRAGTSLVMVEYTFVHETGKSEENQLAASSDLHVPGLFRLASLVKASGAMAGLQITHAGGKTERSLTGGVLMGPSNLAVPVKDRELEKTTPMTADEISLWKSSFLEAVRRAVQAGFDLVELHAAHGYGLNQWLSPLTNQRQDQYGCDRQGRSRLLLEIASEIKTKYPRLGLSVRMPGQDFIEGGLTTADCLEIAQDLEKGGMDLIHVSSGIGGWRRPRDRSGEGYLVSEAALIQKAVQIPVIGVGGIETGTYIDQALQSGKFSLAAVGRAILSSAQEWGDLHLGRGEAIPQLKLEKEMNLL